MLLKDKVVIVTGGGQGIGRAFALRLAEEGARVVIAEINAARGQAVAEEIRARGGQALAVPTDVSDPASAEAMARSTVEAFGRIDALVNNAAIYYGLQMKPFDQITLEKLAALPARFRDNGTVTPGNASGINDGAAAAVICTERLATERGWQPTARLVSWATAGVPPEIMGIGPVPAIRLALQRAGRTLADMDVIEVNEAFAAQALAVEKELGLDRARLNVNGGAIAIGHPLGASGARLLVTLMVELRERGARYGVASLCIGGGQGIAAVVENLRR